MLVYVPFLFNLFVRSCSLILTLLACHRQKFNNMSYPLLLMQLSIIVN